MLRKPQPLTGCFLRALFGYRRWRHHSAHPESPSRFRGRAARCAPRQLTRFARSLAAVLASQGVPLSGCPFQSRPGVVAGSSRAAATGPTSSAEEPARGAVAVTVLSLSRLWCCRGPGGLKGRRSVAPKGSRCPENRRFSGSEKSPISREADPYLNRAVRRGSDMSLSDRERPRAFKESALLSSVATSAPGLLNKHIERLRTFQTTASKLPHPTPSAHTRLGP